MKFVKTLLASAALAATFGASAAVVGSLGGGTGSFLALAGPVSDGGTFPCTNATCTLGGIATISGGALYAADQSFADIPAGGSIFGGLFLAAGPTSTQPSTLTFTTPVNYISFLWGSPDLYNTLTVNSNGAGGGSQTFSAAGLGFAVTNGNQSFSQYVQFVANAGSQITSLVFNNIPSINAFETANYSVVRVVPEPETYALMLAGLGALGFISRRRKRV